MKVKVTPTNCQGGYSYGWSFEAITNRLCLQAKLVTH